MFGRPLGSPAVTPMRSPGLHPAQLHHALDGVGDQLLGDLVTIDLGGAHAPDQGALPNGARLRARARRIGTCGRWAATSRAERPEMRGHHERAPGRAGARTRWRCRRSCRTGPGLCGPAAARGSRSSARRAVPVSVRRAIAAIIATVSTGCAPIAVSWESISASVPSRIALATSVTSARVGRRGGDHRLEHLGGGDRRPRQLAGQGDDPLLHQRHLLDPQLDAQVPARDHHAVGRVDDRLRVLHRLRLLDLGDQRQVGVLAHVGHVLLAAHEGQRHHVHADRLAEAQQLQVLLGHRRQRVRARRARSGPAAR